LGIKVISLLTFFLTQKKVSPERAAHSWLVELKKTQKIINVNYFKIT